MPEEPPDPLRAARANAKAPPVRRFYKDTAFGRRTAATR